YNTRGFYALKLADLLSADTPVFLLHPQRKFDTELDASIEAMARSYLPELLAARPNGAFRLGGYCKGGQLAWELAHQLGKAGRDVEVVVLMATVSLNARPTLRLIARMLTQLASVSPKKIGESLRLDGMRAVWRWKHAAARILRIFGLNVAPPPSDGLQLEVA